MCRGATIGVEPPTDKYPQGRAQRVETEGFGQGLELMNTEFGNCDKCLNVVRVVMLGEVPQANRARADRSQQQARQTHLGIVARSG